ncbi:response regulator transcription factor [Oscillospiraceae bacterium WX1]
MSDIRLLIVDRDEHARMLVKKLAENSGYTADTASDGVTAVKLFRRYDYQLVVMDTELPSLDGWNVCRQIRKLSDVPVIIVSALNGENDKLMAFDAGADDYLCKPYSQQELLARIRVFIYRCAGLKTPPRTKITYTGLYIDTASRAVFVNDAVVKLTPKEYDLLYFMSQNPNKAFSREMLLNEVWGYEFIGSDRTVDTHIKMLRDNLKPYDAYIVTVWGFGYKFVVTSDPALL